MKCANGYLFAAAAALLSFGSSAIAQDKPAPVAVDPGAESQIQEFVISVSDLEPMRKVFTDVLKWKVIYEGAAKPAEAKLWGLKPGVKAEEILLGNAASAYGHVRLVRFKDVEQQQIRPLGRWWDTGGMFNLNVLVKDAAATEAALAGMGWHALGLPDKYEYPGDVRGVSQIMVGPDDLVLSFQERASPPLKGWPEFAGATHIEVGYQLVADLDAWYPFFAKVLGLEPRAARLRSSGKPVGPNDYGLPHNLVGVDDSKQGGVFPRKGGEQLIGARQFTNAKGYDFSERAAPPNLGIMSMRLPFADIDPILERASAAGIAPAAGPHMLEMAPYGMVKAAAFRAPQSGLWVEVFETGAAPMTAAELAAFFRSGGKGQWSSFGGTAAGTMAYERDGTAEVTWATGRAEGTWAVKGNTLCTAWKTMRDGREQCAVYYRLGPKTFQSYQLDGTPDGFNTFD